MKPQNQFCSYLLMCLYSKMVKLKSLIPRFIFQIFLWFQEWKPGQIPFWEYWSFAIRKKKQDNCNELVYCGIFSKHQFWILKRICHDKIVVRINANYRCKSTFWPKCKKLFNTWIYIIKNYWSQQSYSGNTISEDLTV